MNNELKYETIVEGGRLESILPPLISANHYTVDIIKEHISNCIDVYTTIFGALMMIEAKKYVDPCIDEMDAPFVLREQNIELFNEITNKCSHEARAICLPHALTKQTKLGGK